MNKIAKNILSKEGIILTIAISCLLVSLVFNKIYTNRISVHSYARAAERYIAEKSKKFDDVTEDSMLVRHLSRQINTSDELLKLTNLDFGVFLYYDGQYGQQLRFWNEQLVKPNEDILHMPEGEGFFLLPNGYYYVKKKQLKGSFPVMAYALILVQSDFFIATDYLPIRFSFDKDADKSIRIVEDSTEFPVKSVQGETLFYLQQKGFGGIPQTSGFTIFLRVISLLLLLYLVYLQAEKIAATKRKVSAIALLAGAMLFLRVLIYQFPSILNLRQFELFDPSIYGYDIIQRSLGDLLINALLASWLIVYAWSKLQFSAPQKNWKKWGWGVIALCGLIGSTFIVASVIRSIVADSKISFDVTDFSSLTIYTAIGFVVLASLTLAYYYFCQLLFRVMELVFRDREYWIYIGIAFAGLLYLTFNTNHSNVLFYLPVLLWLVVFTFLVKRQGVILYRIRVNLAGIVFWILIFSVSIAAIMFTENEKAEWARRKFYAEKLFVKSDPSSETLMSIATKYIDSSFLANNFNRFLDSTQNKFLRDSILKVNYSAYLDLYTTKLFVYDSAGTGLGNEDPTTYNDLKTIVEVQSKLTGVNDLYYYETSFDKFAYITARQVVDSAGVIGHFFVISNPKKYSADAILPELFRQFKKDDPENSPIYSYAVYNDRTLVTSSNRYPFKTTLNPDVLSKEEVSKVTTKSSTELWFKASSNKIIVMARKKDTLIEAITLFSWIFCSFLLLVGLGQVAAFLVKPGSMSKKIRAFVQPNIRSQVHTTFIFISVFSFIIIGVATISFFFTRYDRNNSDKLSRTMNIMITEMQKRIQTAQDFKMLLQTNDSTTFHGLQKLVDDVSDIHGVAVNIYNLQGSLVVSSQKDVYTKGVLSNKMDPTAYFHLARMNEVERVQKEKIGNLTYMSAYAPARYNKTAYPYLGIPYFTSQQELNLEISNFLVTIINLNAFIFLIAGLIALYITNRITRSLSLISDKMREVNLSKRNEVIEWNRDDEIGELVKEYNKMVSKLDESASALAKTEREGAWREMARQVAHEIKNPLTPMKLSLQYLQKAIDSDQQNIGKLTRHVSNTLVEQIDHLAKIAADFSQFANIGNTKVEVFDLHEILAILKDLYSSNTEMELTWSPVSKEINIAADKTQMNRLFTNLLVNAMEACKDRHPCRIHIGEREEDGHVVISITDNGEGIAIETQAHIFVPNFTTKTSGTGLGLAMCKGIVEQARGDIWFETTQDVGTTFHVKLPLVNETEAAGEDNITE